MNDDLMSVPGEFAAIQLPLGEITPYSLSLPRLTPFAQWEEIGLLVSKIQGASSWWIGDLILAGESLYGDRIYNESIALTHYDYATIQNKKWVSKVFPVARRRPELTYSHHQEVASNADLSEADQDTLLEQAVQNKWSSKDLRKKLREIVRARQGRADDLIKLTFMFRQDQVDEIETILIRCQQQTHMPEREDCLLFMLRLFG